MHQISFSFFQRGITPEREITLTRKENAYQLFFHEESIYEISKPLHAQFLTNGRTTNIMPVNFFEVGGIINKVGGVGGSWDLAPNQEASNILETQIKWKYMYLLNNETDYFLLI